MSERTWTEEQKVLFELGTDGLPNLKRIAVSADAGSGKTTTLVERVKHWIEAAGGEPPIVLCVSFTEKSAADLESRFARFPSVEVYTIHGYCARVVQEFGSRLGLAPMFRILDADEERRELYSCFERVFKRRPLRLEDHGPDTYWNLLRSTKEKRSPGRHVPVLDSSGESAELTSFCDEVLAEFETRKVALKALEYSDLERFCAKLLEAHDVRAILRARYKHVFIDEFQDTSALQCDIARALTGEQGMLFVVGDEKQSIYRFRGAEVDVFREFCKTLPENRRLSKNYRSDAAIIDAVNAVCGPVIEGYAPMTAGAGSLSNMKYKAARVTSESDADGVEAILRHLDSLGEDRSKTVLLLRKVSGSKLVTELQRRGIRLVSMGSGLASDNPATQALVNLWIWACEPDSKLRSAAVAVEFSSDPEATRTALPDGLPAAIEAVDSLTCEELLAHLDERFSLRKRFGATFDEFALFISLQQSKGILPAALAVRLVEIERDGGKFEEMVSMPPPPELAGAIRVMTVHASKGLEFPHVILADLDPRKPPRGAIVSEKATVSFCDLRDEDGGLEKHDAFVQAVAREDAAELAESGRLLYVAMTRAQNSLFAVTRPDPAEESKKPKKPATGWGAWLKAGLSKTVSCDELLAGINPPVKQESVKAEVRSMPKLETNAAAVQAQARIGVTALVRVRHGEDERIEVQNQKEKKPGRPDRDYRALGTVIHRHFQNEDWTALEEFMVSEKIPVKALRTWVDGPAAKEVFPGGSARVLREFAFDWKTGEHVIAGRVDRMVVMPDGEVRVYDFKVLFSKKSADEFASEYREQMQIYRAAIAALTGGKVRTFLLDVTGATGRIVHEV